MKTMTTSIALAAFIIGGAAVAGRITGAEERLSLYRLAK